MVVCWLLIMKDRIRFPAKDFFLRTEALSLIWATINLFLNLAIKKIKRSKSSGSNYSKYKDYLLPPKILVYEHDPRLNWFEFSSVLWAFYDCSCFLWPYERKLDNKFKNMFSKVNIKLKAASKIEFFLRL